MSELKKIAIEICSTATKPEILKHLHTKKGNYVTQIAKALNKDKSTISRHLDSLEEAELVKWEYGTLDKKKKFYSLTEKGKAVTELISKEI